MDFAKRFQRLRQEAGLSKTALGAPRYTVSHVSKIESGVRKPSPEALAFFASKLGVTPETLSTGVPEGTESRLGYRLSEAREALNGGRAEEAEAIARDVCTEAKEVGLASVASQSLTVLAQALARIGRVSEGIGAYEEALEGSLPKLERGMAIASLGALYRDAGDLLYAGELLESFLNQEGPDLDPGAQTAISSVLISVYMERGDMLRAQGAAEHALATAEKRVPANVRAGAYWNASQVMAERGQWQDALDFASRARALMEELNDRRNVARLHNAYAYICLDAKPPRLEEAGQHLDLAETILREVGSEDDLAHVSSERARLFLMQGRPGDALQHATQAARLAGGNDLERAKGLLASGRSLRQMSRLEEAVEAMREAMGLFEKHRVLGLQATCSREIGDVELELGNTEEGIDALRQATEILSPTSW